MATPMQGDVRSQPETGNYTFKQVMQAQNTTYEIDLCPSQLKQVCSATHPPCLELASLTCMRGCATQALKGETHARQAAQSV